LTASPVQCDEALLSLKCTPGHGEQTDARLGELGYSDDEITDLNVKSVVL